MEKIINKSKKSLNSEGKREFKISQKDQLINEIGMIEMRIHFHKEDIVFFESALEMHKKKLKKLGISN